MGADIDFMKLFTLISEWITALVNFISTTAFGKYARNLTPDTVNAHQ